MQGWRAIAFRVQHTAFRDKTLQVVLAFVTSSNMTSVLLCWAGLCTFRQPSRFTSAHLPRATRSHLELHCRDGQSTEHEGPVLIPLASALHHSPLQGRMEPVVPVAAGAQSRCLHAAHRGRLYRPDKDGGEAGFDGASRCLEVPWARGGPGAVAGAAQHPAHEFRVYQRALQRCSVSCRDRAVVQGPRAWVEEGHPGQRRRGDEGLLLFPAELQRNLVRQRPCEVLLQGHAHLPWCGGRL